MNISLNVSVLHSQAVPQFRSCQMKGSVTSVGRHCALAGTNKVAFVHVVSSYMYNLFKGRVVKSYGILLSKG